MRAIAYYRSLFTDPKNSEQSTQEQNSGVAIWTASDDTHQIIAEYMEDEDRLGSRPALRAAVAACKRQNASLLIASTEAIGRGKPFHPRVRSVPVIKLPTPVRALGYVKCAPFDAPDGLSLYFDNHAEARVCDVYLCNGSGVAWANVMLTISAVTTNLSDLSPLSDLGSEAGVISSSTAIRNVGLLPSARMTLVTDYDRLLDGDFILVCELTCRGSGAKMRAIVDKGRTLGGFLRFYQCP